MRLQRQRKAPGREGGGAPQAKGTKKRQSQGNSYLRRAKGEELCTSLVLANKSREGEREDKLIKEEEMGVGKAGESRL